MKAKRPPIEETASFLQSLLASHGPNYLEKLFGSKARDALAPLGGVEKVAIALSESQTIEGEKISLEKNSTTGNENLFYLELCFHLIPMQICFHLLNRFRCSFASDAIWLGAFALRLHGCWKWWFRDVKIARHQRLGAGRCEVFPRKVGEHRIPGLSCARTVITVLLFCSDWSSVLFLLGSRFRWLQLLRSSWYPRSCLTFTLWFNSTCNVLFCSWKCIIHAIRITNDANIWRGRGTQRRSRKRLKAKRKIGKDFTACALDGNVKS